MISVTSSGSWAKTESYLRTVQKPNILGILQHYGQAGVSALSSATPLRTGLAASSWFYEVGSNASGFFINWFNSDIENGFPVVIGLQYGYGTGTGGYVSGQDFINPAIRPIMDQISEDVWKVVTSA